MPFNVFMNKILLFFIYVLLKEEIIIFLSISDLAKAARKSIICNSCHTNLVRMGIGRGFIQ